MARLKRTRLVGPGIRRTEIYGEICGGATHDSDSQIRVRYMLTLALRRFVAVWVKENIAIVNDVGDI